MIARSFGVSIDSILSNMPFESGECVSHFSLRVTGGHYVSSPLTIIVVDDVPISDPVESL